MGMGDEYLGNSAHLNCALLYLILRAFPTIK